MTIPNSIFTTFTKLEIFDASSTSLQEINSLSFNKASSLLYILLQQNRLKIIKDYTFVHCKALKILDLAQNDIQTVQKYAFISLERLERLDLGRNKIKSIDDDIFQSLSNVQWIWMNNNRIKRITSKIFTKKNSMIEGIDFKHNGIIAISPYAFVDLEKLRFLMLNGNKCVKRDFKNHIIYENVAIALELNECYSKYRKLVPTEDVNHNLTLKFERAIKHHGICQAQILLAIEELNNVTNLINELQ